MDNYCSHIPMPAARSEAKVRPYDVPVRPESIIDLNFERTRDEKINAILGMARCSYLLGKTFKLKYNYSFAIPVLEYYALPFEIVGAPKLLQVEKQINENFEMVLNKGK